MLIKDVNPIIWDLIRPDQPCPKCNSPWEADLTEAVNTPDGRVGLKCACGQVVRVKVTIGS